MQPVICWIILLGISLLCVVAVILCRWREMKEDWQERRPPRLRNYLWNAIESILEFFS